VIWSSEGYPKEGILPDLPLAAGLSELNGADLLRRKVPPDTPVNVTDQLLTQLSKPEIIFHAQRKRSAP